MAVKSGVSIDPIALATSDTTLAEVSGGFSLEIYAGWLHNTTAGVVEVEIFCADSDTSASSDRVFSAVLDPGESRRIPQITVGPGRFLIGSADAAGVNFYGSATQRSGSDVGVA